LAFTNEEVLRMTEVALQKFSAFTVKEANEKFIIAGIPMTSGELPDLFSSDDGALVPLSCIAGVATLIE
jgi:hypothetical protein